MCGTSSNGVPASGGSGLSCRWVTPTTSPTAPSPDAAGSPRATAAPTGRSGSPRPGCRRRRAFASTPGSRAEVVGGRESAASGRARACPPRRPPRSRSSRPSGRWRCRRTRTRGRPAAPRRWRRPGRRTGSARGRRGGRRRPAPDAGDAHAVLLVRRQVGGLRDGAAAEQATPQRSAGNRGPVSALDHGPPERQRSAARPAGSSGSPRSSRSNTAATSAASTTSVTSAPRRPGRAGPAP